MNNEVFDTYEGFKFDVEFISNGYLLTYKDHGTRQTKQKAFYKWDNLVSFLQSYYSEEWV